MPNGSDLEKARGYRTAADAELDALCRGGEQVPQFCGSLHGTRLPLDRGSECLSESHVREHRAAQYVGCWRPGLEIDHDSSRTGNRRPLVRACPRQKEAGTGEKRTKRNQERKHRNWQNLSIMIWTQDDEAFIVCDRVCSGADVFDGLNRSFSR